MTLSTKAKESFKTALAITIAYGIALSMNWMGIYRYWYRVCVISVLKKHCPLNNMKQ